jgi:PAS domain S-box-containing protein
MQLSERPTADELIFNIAIVDGNDDGAPHTSKVRYLRRVESTDHGVLILDAAKRARNERRTISKIVHGILTTPNLGEFLKLVHRSLSQVVYAENCYVMLHDPIRDMMNFEFWIDKYDDDAPPPLRRGMGFCSYVLRTGQPLLLTQDTRKRLVDSGEVEPHGNPCASWIGVPLRTPQRTIGVLAVCHYDDEHAYNGGDLDLLSSVGDQIALAVERKRAENALNESNEKFRQLAANVSDVFYMTSPDMREMLYISPAYERVFGRSTESLYADPSQWPDAILEEDRDGVMATFSSLSSAVAEASAEFRIRQPNGAIRWILSRSFPVLDERGNVIRITGIATDITEQKNAKAALEESEASFKSLFESASDAILVLNDDRFLACNPAAEKLFGCRKEDIIGRSPLDFAPIEQPDGRRSCEIAADYMKAALVDGPQFLKWRCRRLDGTIFDSEMSLNRVDFRGAVHIRQTLRDVTQTTELEGQLRQSQKMEAIGVLAGGIAHDFNNLLTAINGYSELTLEQMSPDDALRHNIEEIKNAGIRASQLTSQLLAFSRKQVLQPVASTPSYSILKDCFVEYFERASICALFSTQAFRTSWPILGRSSR